MQSSTSKLGSVRHFSTTLKSLRSLVGVSHQECAYPIAGKAPKKVSLKDAFQGIKTGDHIFVHGIAASKFFFHIRFDKYLTFLFFFSSYTVVGWTL